MSNYKNLNVWILSMKTVKEIYNLTRSYPQDEQYGLKSQTNRAAVSIPSNIAEGSGRVSKKEFQHFISVAMGSSFELETQIILAFRFNYIKEEQLNDFSDLIGPVQKMSFGLYNSLEK